VRTELNNPDVPAEENQPERVLPIFAIASWLLPVLVWLCTLAFVRAVQSAQRRSGYFDGFGESIIGMALVLLAAAVCSIIAFRRHELGAPLVFLPLVASVAYFTFLFLAR
jgi:hypothetical protein